MLKLIEAMCLLEARGLADYVFWPDDISLCYGNV